MSNKKELNSEECCIHDEVMKQIHEEHITMKPRIFFLAGSVLLGVGVVGTAVVAVFFSNLMFYKLRYEEMFEYLGFGSIGLKHFLITFPWIPLIFSLGGLIGGSYLIRKYDIIQKHRFTRLMAAFVVMSLVLGFMLDRMGTNGQMSRMRPLRNMYEHENNKPFVRGEIISINGNNIIIITPLEDEVIAHIDAPKNIPLQPGSIVRAIGEWENGVFYIKRIIVR